MTGKRGADRSRFNRLHEDLMTGRTSVALQNFGDRPSTCSTRNGEQHEAAAQLPRNKDGSIRKTFVKSVARRIEAADARD